MSRRWLSNLTNRLIRIRKMNNSAKTYLYSKLYSKKVTERKAKISATLIPAACGLSILFYTVAHGTQIWGCKNVIKILTVCFLSGISFFILGFLASSEDVANLGYWKASYAVVLIFSVVLNLKLIGVPKIALNKKRYFFISKNILKVFVGIWWTSTRHVSKSLFCSLPYYHVQAWEMCWQNSQTYFLSPSMTLIIGLAIPAETHNAKHQTSTA